MEESYYHHMADIQARHWWYEGRRIILQSVLHHISLPDNPRIIEVGCGTGANLAMLKNFGSVVGIEPNPFGRGHATKISGCDIRDGALPDNIPFKESYNLVCAFDVVEHVGDDTGSLETLYGLTAPGGYALFTVPAWMFLWSQHDVINHHKRRYTRPAFVKLLRDSGYDVIFDSYYNFWLFPLIALIRLTKNILKMKDSPDMTTPPMGFMNMLLTSVFASEQYLLGKTSLPFGVSIIALCRKST